MSATTKTMISALEFGNRFDAEMYRPSLLTTFNQMLRCPYPLIPLRRLCLVRSGTTPPDRVDGVQKGPILFKTTDIRNGSIAMDGDYYHISDAIHNRMFKTRLEDRDVLMNIVGATLDVIGRVAFLCGLSREANITQAMVLLRCLTSEMRPGYLFAFLCTRYGQDQIARFARPTGQYNLNLKEVGSIRIPLLPDAQQADVEQSCVAAAAAQSQCRRSYCEATSLLATELGLDHIKQITPRGYAVPLSSVELDNRFDAHHFHPAFITIVDHCRRLSCVRLRDIRTYNRRGVQPQYAANGDIDVINSQHITGMHLDYAAFEKTTRSAYMRSPEAHIRTNDILIYSTGAYVGRANVYLGEAQVLASNHVSILRVVDSFDSAYVSMVMQSVVGQAQTQMWVRGSTQVELYPTDIDRFYIPVLPKKTQVRIGDLLRDSFAQQCECDRLLLKAKARVEQLIEEAIEQ